MRLLIVSQYFWPEGFRINELAVSLAERGHEVTVLTGLPNYPEGRIFKGYGAFFGPFKETHQGVRILRAPLVPRGASKGLRLALNYASFALSAAIVGAFRCRGPYDAILVYEPSPVTVGLPALLLRALRRGNVLFWVQDLWPETLEAIGAVRSPRVLAWVGSLVRFIYQRCDLILIQSRAFQESVEKFGIAPSKVRYFPNSAEALFKPETSDPGSPEANLMPRGFRVLFAGNIGAAQDFETILAAAELLKPRSDIQWIVLGDGRMKDWVATEIKKRGLAATFHLLGRFPVERMPRFFAEADALLVTLKDEPIFALTVPSKVQSYLASGKPILAALRGEGARVVEESGSGLSCAPEDPAALAKVVLKLQEMDPAEREAMGARGRTYFEENFKAEKLVTQLETWMKHG